MSETIKKAWPPSEDQIKNLILKTYFVSVFNANKIYQNYNISDDI